MRRGTSLLAAAFVLALAAPAHAWDRPVRLPETINTIPHIDGHGTIRALLTTPRHRVEVGQLRWGTRRLRHCGVRGIGRNAQLVHSDWSANDAGAMVYAWSTRGAASRLRIASAAPGRCFRRRSVVQRGVPRETRFLRVLLAPLGTTVAYWGPVRDESEYLAAGPLGGRLGGRRRVTPPRRGLELTAPLAFLGGDRTLWTWGVKEPLPGDGGHYREEVWGSFGGARGGRPRGGRKLAQVRGHDEEGYADRGATVRDLKFVTDARGGQVAGGFSADRFVLMSRRPGRAFGKARVFPGVYRATSVESAGNRRGDAVFVWHSGSEGPIHALVRRRNGRVVGPTIVSNAAGGPHTGEASVGIDGAGRVVVAYVAQSGAEISQLVPNQIHVAVSDRRGRFGAPKSVTGPPDTINQLPHVSVNSRGQAAITFTRYRWRSDGNFDPYTLVTRRRLGG